MTTEQSVGAASHASVLWREINWRLVNEGVRRLQVRIVKAVETGRWGKVKALQRLLTSSQNGKLLAVRRVTENQGRKTSGVDGVSWDTPEKKMAAVATLRGRGYRPLPLRRIYIPKSNGKLRPLGIPTMKDRAMQALHLLALDPIAETTADENSYGFRKRRSCADAIEGCFAALKHRNPSWALEGDIRGCFDNISHAWLMAHVPMDKTILRKWLKSGYMEKRSFYATEQGTPQGGIISPVLANLALDGLERRLREKYPQRGKGSWHGRAAGVHLIRYADDFIITGVSKELLENEVKPLVESFLRERGLELSAEKTSVTHIEAGFDFLGQNVRRYSNGKLLIKPSRKNIHTFLENVREVVRKAQGYPAWQMITTLNRMIRGWATYHRHAVSKRIFSRVDYAIFKALWRWSLKRHPRKGKRWVMRKYFARRGGRGWCFFGEKKLTMGGGRTYGCSMRPRSRSAVTSRSSETRIRTIPSGKCTSNLVTADTWPRHFRAVGHCSISGADNAEGAPNAEIPSLARPGGTAITSSQKCWAARMALPTADFFIQNAIANCTVNSAASATASLTRR